MNVKEVRLTLQVSSTSFLHSNYWLNFLILDLMEPLLRAKILHNSSIVSPLEYSSINFWSSSFVH